MKQTSAGVLITNSYNQILGCIAYGKNGICDIPKGRIEEGESPLCAAIRETKEETGLDLSDEKIEEIGFFPYNKEKDLYLFSYKCDIDDLSKLKCTSYYEYNGSFYPEMIGFKWININENDIKNSFYFSLYKILNKLLIKK